MKGDFIDIEMEKLGADGVDFVPVLAETLSGSAVVGSIRTYTREEWASVAGYPRSGRRYWKLVDGKREFINSNELKKNGLLVREVFIEGEKGRYILELAKEIDRISKIQYPKGPN